MVQCPSCARPQVPRLICSDCGSPLASDLDYFAALDLPRSLRIGQSALEQIYHELGRRLHPDRFANAAATVRERSLRATSILTRAYRTLRDPVARGRYWLELNGRKLGENNQKVPSELVEIVFETQEELAELHAANGSQAEVARVKARRAEVFALAQQLDRDLGDNFSGFDRADALASEEMFNDLKRILSAMAYVKTLIRDIDKALDTKAAA